MTTQSLDPLLDPIQLGALRLRNRMVSTSHEPAYAEDGLPKGRYRRYHEEKARGGVGLTMIGGSAVVAQDSPSTFGNMHLYKDEIVPWMAELAESVHEQGAGVLCQVTHLGRRTSNYAGDWLPLLAPSPIREPAHRAFPKTAESWDLDRVVTAYADAVARCRAAGLDGVELYGGGHLLDAFWSPATNHRTDEFGGDEERRLAFPLRVVRAVRDAAGPGMLVALRMAVDEELPGGVRTEHGMEITRRLIAEGVDLVNVLRGHIDSDDALSRMIPPLGTPSAPHLEFAGTVREALAVPVMHAARINDVATARYAVREGLVDLVGMTRAHLADPHLVAKVRSGDTDRIRPCVGATYCLDSIYQGGDAKCVHNPSTGREETLPHTVEPADGPPRRVVVVGAGPAGLEAARVLGERGHRVTLLEAADQAGGQVRLAASLPRRRELIGLVDWRVSECKQLGVDIRYNTLAGEEEVLAEEPDLVLVATGGLPACAVDEHAVLDGGAELVYDTWDVLSGSARLRGSVLVYDDNGAQPALDAAESLLRSGAQVELVTPERTVGVEVGGVTYPAYAKVFAEHGAALTVNQRLFRVERRDGRLSAHLRGEHGTVEQQRPVDHVVVEHGTLPQDELYFALQDGSSNGGEVDQDALLQLRAQTVRRHPDGRYQLFRLGDAVASRNVHAAVYDAFRLCLAL